MKKTAVLLLTIVFIICNSISCNAEEALSIDEYRADIYNSIEQRNGLDITPNNLNELTAQKVLDYFFSILKQCVKSPIAILCTLTAMSVIQRLCEIISNGKEIYRDIFTMIAFVAIVPQILSSLTDLASAMESAQGFMVGYIPIYASVVAASGNISAATSYSAILLYATEGASILISLLIKPLISCMTVMSVIRAISQDMPDITSAVRRLLVSLTGFVMTIFLGVIGLQGIIGRTQDSITLKASKYLISSFVPIIGGTLNESYRTVKLSLDSIRSVVGCFGIAIIITVLCIPIIKGFVYRWIFTLTEFISGSVGTSGISNLCKGLSDVYLLLTTLVTLYTLMLVIATGALISLGGSLL